MAVPFGSPVFTLYYRADILEKLGARPPRTWIEYQKLAERLPESWEILGVDPAVSVKPGADLSAVTAILVGSVLGSVLLALSAVPGAETAPRSSWILASGVTCASSTPSCSTSMSTTALVSFSDSMISIWPNHTRRLRP